MALQPGSRFGKYEILGLLGRGGMGEVYRSRDPQLNRLIAIKILHPETADEKARVARFEKEAQTVSRLSHPSIVTIYEMGDQPEPYIAMELVEGKTLRDLLTDGALPLRRALELSAQVADGLACAHEAGVVHRDLKPENILVTDEGRAKIVDFGLAKLKPHSITQADSQAGTLLEHQTLPGTIIGTVAYMSPEQARGEEANFRSDQFALGAIIYEMVTGKRAFVRSSVVETLSAILREEPEAVSQLNPRVPGPLRWVIERCLEKSPHGRYSSTRDLARELQNLREHFAEIAVSYPSWSYLALPWPRFWLRLRRPILIGLALIVAAVMGGLVFRPSQPPPTEFRRVTFRRGYVRTARFSPDGKSVVYAATWRGEPYHSYLALRSGTASERLLSANACIPMAFDKEGARVLVLQNVRRLRGTLAWQPVLGGEARPVLENIVWAEWAPKGHFYIVVRDTGTERSLEIVEEDGRPRSVLDKTLGMFFDLRISPDERQVAYVFHPSRHNTAGIVRAARIDTGGFESLSPLYPYCAGLTWHPQKDEIWFTASETGQYPVLRSVVSGTQPRSLLSSPGMLYLHDISSDGQEALVSSANEQKFVRSLVAGGQERDLSWLDWSEATDISPDGKRLLFSEAGRVSAESSGLWMRPLEGGDAVRLGDGLYGAFSADGNWVAATTSPASGPPQLVLIPTGPGKVQRLSSGEGRITGAKFLQDGSALLAVYAEKDEPGAIWKISLEGKRIAQLTPPGCSHPLPHPDGKSFACVCDSGRRLQVYPISGGAGKPIWEAPSGETVVPLRWSTNRGELFAFVGELSNQLVAVSTTPGTAPQVIQNFFPASADGWMKVVSAVVTPDARVRAWTIVHAYSDLYLANHLP